MKRCNMSDNEIEDCYNLMGYEYGNLKSRTKWDLYK